MNRARVVWTAVALIATGVMQCATAGAFVPSPSHAQLQTAIAQGESMARAGVGYHAGVYLLYGLPNATTIRSRSPVEAILIATPWESVRYRSYLDWLEQSPLTPAAAVRLARRERGIVTLVVFAHGNGVHDNHFLRRIRNARLVLADGRMVHPNVATRSSLATYPYHLRAGIEDRYSGDVSFAFALGSDRAAHGRFAFVDSAGGNRSFAFDLARLE